MFLIFRSRHKNFDEKIKIVVKNSEKLNCSYGKVSHELKMHYLIFKTMHSLQNNFPYNYMISVLTVCLLVQSRIFPYNLLQSKIDKSSPPQAI